MVSKIYASGHGLDKGQVRVEGAALFGEEPNRREQRRGNYPAQREKGGLLDRNVNNIA